MTASGLQEILYFITVCTLPGFVAWEYLPKFGDGIDPWTGVTLCGTTFILMFLIALFALACGEAYVFIAWLLRSVWNIPVWGDEAFRRGMIRV